MEAFLLVVEYFAGLFLLFVAGRIIGHILSLDKCVYFFPDQLHPNSL